MAMPAALTQTTLHLEMLTLEVHSLIDRTMPLEILHEIAAYCVPRKLHFVIHIWGVRGNEGFMRLDIEIDFRMHDPIVSLGGCDLQDGVAGEYWVADPPASLASGRSSTSCPHIGKAVDLFMANLRARGLLAAWWVSFRDHAEELNARFGLRCHGGSFTDHTAGLPASTIHHSVLPELSVSCRDGPAPEDSVQTIQQDERRRS